MNSDTISHIFIYIVLPVIAICSFYPLIQLLLTSDRLNKTGKVINARVLDHERHVETHYNKGNASTTTTYKINYEFQVPDGEKKPGMYVKSQQVGGETFKKILNGEMVDIKYWPTNPNVSQLTGQFQDNSQRWQAIFTFIVFGIGGLAFVVGAILKKY